MKRFFCFLACAFFVLSAGSQSIDSTLEKYANNFQPEKLYLHYDKSAYAPGETVWFKAYLMEEFYPSNSSKSLYIDWVAPDGKVLSHIVSPIIEGTTNGQFEIPSGYNGQQIHVRAYTRWMLNFDTAFLYSRDLRILSKSTKGAKPTIVSSLVLFPEGGDLITGVNNNVAFKATDQFGQPVNIRGAVVDEKGTVIDSIRSVHDGMGKFLLTPKSGSVYSVKWKDEKGTWKTTEVPAAKASGLSMQVIASGNRSTVLINSSEIMQQPFHLIGTMNQRLAFKTDVSLASAGNARKVIPTEGLPTGVLTITLFDTDWNAIAERVVFINNGGYSFEPSLEVKRWGLGKRKRNEIEITVPDSLADASLSIAVTDVAIGADSSHTIISQLLLSSEIKGYVHDPAYYFFPGNKDAAQHLDLVMMTNGWRRFKWQDVVKGKTPALTFPKDSAYLSLSGKLVGVSKSQLSGKDNIVLIVKEDTSTKMLIMPIETDGSFGDPNVIPFDTAQIYYSLKSKFLKQAEARFMLDRLPAPNYSTFSRSFRPANPFSDTLGSYHQSRLAAEALRLQQELQGKVMETVTVKAKQKTPVQLMDERYASGLFSGGDSYQFDLVNDPLASAHLSIFTYLQGKVAGLQVNTGTNPPSMVWRGGAPAVFIDEMQSDANMVSSIPVNDIAYVKVFRPPFMGGDGGANGAIAIYTRRGNDGVRSSSGGLSSHKIAGYTNIKEFYSPNYDSFDPRDVQPDLRTTIYWNPQIRTTAKKRTVTLVFYNNDVTKAFRVVVEGMTKDGMLTHFEQIME